MQTGCIMYQTLQWTLIVYSSFKKISDKFCCVWPHIVVYKWYLDHPLSQKATYEIQGPLIIPLCSKNNHIEMPAASNQDSRSSSISWIWIDDSRYYAFPEINFAWNSLCTESRLKCGHISSIMLHLRCVRSASRRTILFYLWIYHFP